jgi:hypothetical protein
MLLTWILQPLMQKVYQEVIVMLIRVKYEDDRFDMVRPVMLNRLLEAGKVLEFRRSDGWVMPGIDSLRRGKMNAYFGTERRMNLG